jgi:hypothetical protein
MHNLFISRIRQTKRRGVTEPIDTADPAVLAQRANQEDPLRRMDLMRALDELPEDQRSVRFCHPSRQGWLAGWTPGELLSDWGGERCNAVHRVWRGGRVGTTWADDPGLPTLPVPRLW